MVSLQFSVDEFADAMEDDEVLSSMFDRVASTIQARSFVSAWADNTAGTSFTVTSGTWTPDDLQRYATDFQHKDPWTVAHLADWQPDRVRDTAHLLAPERFQASELYNDFLRPIGDDMLWGLAVAYESQQGVGCYCFHRGNRQKPFDDAERIALEGVAKPFVTILKTRNQLGSLRRSGSRLEDLLINSDREVFVISPDRRLLVANAAAEAMFDEREALSMSRGRIGGTHHENELRLRACLNQVLDMQSGGSADLTLRRRSGGALRFAATLLPHSGQLRRIMFTRCAPSEAERAIQLQAQFALTEAEAKIALLLVDGLNPTQIASKRMVSVGTVRVQIGRIADKLHCSTQAQIVGIVLRSLS